jgi:hypothetical protein
MSIEAQKFEALKQRFLVYGHSPFALHCDPRFWTFHPDSAPTYRDTSGFRWC